jgi:hypothetical protein
MNTVWILFGHHSNNKWVEAVFVDKVLAEATSRQLNDRDKSEGYFYSIQEKGVTR